MGNALADHPKAKESPGGGLARSLYEEKVCGVGYAAHYFGQFYAA